MFQPLTKCPTLNDICLRHKSRDKGNKWIDNIMHWVAPDSSKIRNI